MGFGYRGLGFGDFEGFRRLVVLGFGHGILN